MKVKTFMDLWLESAQTRLRHSTWVSYRTNIHRHIIPLIGDVPLDELSPMKINAMYSALLSQGRIDGKGGLSRRTVSYIHRILHRALRDAVRWGQAETNVCDRADPPLGRSPEMRVWSPAQLQAFLNAVSGDRLYPAWLLASTTGLRRGELLGLRWQDVDLDRGRIFVRQTLLAVGHKLVFSEPKTGRGRRQVFLALPATNVLRTYREEQHFSSSAETLLFTTEDGSPVHPDQFSRRFRRICGELCLPEIRLHDLRHTFASLALQAGIHPKVVSDILGHSNIGITLDTYSHVLPSLGAEAINKVASIALGSEAASDPAA